MCSLAGMHVKLCCELMSTKTKLNCKGGSGGDEGRRPLIGTKACSRHS